MKNKLLTFLLLCLISIQTFAQPDKGSFEFGGSGQISTGQHTSEDKSFTMALNGQVSYFIFRNLSAGMEIYFRGYKKYDAKSETILDELFIGPTIEAYVLNRDKIGVSFKSSMNFLVKTDFAQEVGYSSFLIGPKVAWNITPNLSTFIWIPYRNSENFDDYTQVGSVIPSDNFDVRWGFSYYLHRKGTENN